MSDSRIASYGHENYPKARQVRPTQAVSRVSTTSAVKTGSQSLEPRDTRQGGTYDPHADQMMQLRRRAVAQGWTGGSAGVHPPVRSAPINIDPGYPVAPSKPGYVADSRPLVGQPPRTTNNGLGQGGPQNPPKPGPSGQQVRNTPTQGSKGSSKAPGPDYLSFIQKHQRRIDTNNQAFEAMKSRANADAASAAKPQSKISKPPQSQPKPAAKTQVKKSTSGNARKAAGGAFSVASGAVTLKNGVKNLSNGKYMEGGLQVTQGSLSLVDGINDLNLAHKGLSNAPAGALTKRIKVGGSVLNAGMAAYDTKQAYHAFKNGNQVEGAEKASSAVINAVSAFPPTAVIGAVGGVADWAMQASGADDAMVRALTSGKDKAYQKQVQRDLKLARTLVKTPTEVLGRCNREQKQAYIRGLEGLKEYRQHYASQGRTQTVKDIDAQIARIKGAWSR